MHQYFYFKKILSDKSIHYLMTLEALQTEKAENKYILF